MKFTFTEVDHGFDELKKLAGQKAAAKVGIVGAKATAEHAGPEHLTNAEIALVQEFGSNDGKIPDRSFIRSTFDALRDVYLDHLRGYAGMIYDRAMTLPRAMGLLGQEMSKDVREKIRSGIPPPNAPSTIKRKGSSHTLIDSAQLLGAVNYDVDTTGTPDPDGHREN